MDSLLKGIAMIPWRLVLFITLCLVALHTIFSNQDKFTLHSFNPTESSSRPATEIHWFGSGLRWGRPVPGSDYVAICMAVKDEGPALNEYFVHHYHHLGIKRFYIMDDGSEPPLSTLDFPGVPRSILTFVSQNQVTRMHDTQIHIYNRCQQDYGHLHTWIAYLDADEFLETPGTETLHEILEEFEADDSVGALAVNWKMHGSSGVLTRPESARKAFVHCVSDRNEDTHGFESDNIHVKVIVKTDKAINSLSPHTWNVNGTTVGEHGDVIGGPFRRPITRDRIAVHHYATKSREEFEEKKLRGNAMSDPKDERLWDNVNVRYDLVDCGEMADYSP